MAGIPIYAKKGKYGGIAILDKFVFEKNIVSEDEQIQILAAIQSIQEVEKSGINDLLVKLSGLFQIKNPNWISIDFSDWSNQHQELFQTVKLAIVKTRVLKFDYYGRIGEISTRKVEPIQLWFKGHAWYLRGYCQEKQAIRVFKLSRMKRVECLDESFEKKELNIKDKEQAVAKAKEMCEVFEDHMKDGCINGIAEIFDGEFSATSRGCFTQAWSVAEILRAYTVDILPFVNKYLE